MKEIGIALTALLAISVVIAIVAPVLAARTPREAQVFVKVVDSTGNPVRDADVMLYEGTNPKDATAKTSWVNTKDNGTAVISLNEDTTSGSWNSTMEFTIIVATSYADFYLYGNSFDVPLSANIEVTLHV